ncbi:polysaccharide deacetylase family protein [Baekduia soli]|uniref:polysaccharide deacetylase family protein n=1 Tax=Baekduia soli TaxID=496014 RepID=UPI001652776D|nr:polysaccharide deacetylase family protein [Baekduia soli]
MSATGPLRAGAPAGAALAAALAGEAATYAAKRREIAALRARCRAQRVVVLTFDDGPSRELTPRVLDVLADHGAQATFFALGQRAAGAPEVLDRVRAEGHEIGAHTMNHRNAWRTPPWDALRDIREGYGALAPWVATDGRFRPPHGKQTGLTRRAVRRRGAPVAWWTVDSGDTHTQLPAPDAVVRRVLAEGGGVVLAHDHGAGRPAERQEFVLEVTGRLLRAARAGGLHVRPLRDLA